jgi:hypothetical protein
MPDLRQLLERTGEAIEPEPNALERLQKRHAGRTRSRRVATALVAFSMAAAGMGVILVALGGARHSPAIHPVPSGYYVLLPRAPGPDTAKQGTHVIAAQTNLPEGTRVGFHVDTDSGETYSDTVVHEGFIRIDVTNNECGEHAGQLAGTSFDLTIAVSAYDSRPIHGLHDRPSPLPYQPKAVRDVLGENFERLQGAQVRNNRIEVSREYVLPAKTCIAQLVPMPKGQFQLVPIDPDAPASSYEQVREFVQQFMDARIAGDGAEDFLARPTKRAYDLHDSNQLHLYGVSYIGFEILGIEPLGGKDYYVTLSMTQNVQGIPHRDASQEVFVVGPGQDLRYQSQPLVILSASGGEGP